MDSEQREQYIQALRMTRDKVLQIEENLQEKVKMWKIIAEVGDNNWSMEKVHNLATYQDFKTKREESVKAFKKAMNEAEEAIENMRYFNGMCEEVYKAIQKKEVK